MKEPVLIKYLEINNKPIINDLYRIDDLNQLEFIDSKPNNNKYNKLGIKPMPFEPYQRLDRLLDSLRFDINAQPPKQIFFKGFREEESADLDAWYDARVREIKASAQGYIVELDGAIEDKAISAIARFNAQMRAEKGFKKLIKDAQEAYLKLKF